MVQRYANVVKMAFFEVKEKDVKITTDNIDYNATRLINDEIGSPYEYADQSDDADHQRLLTLGYIHGVLDMAKTMKEVLKA